LNFLIGGIVASPDADDADLFGLDQRDATTRLQGIRQRRSRHPARRAAADDDDAGQSAVFGLHDLQAFTCRCA
jgi:hypothetical protein